MKFFKDRSELDLNRYYIATYEMSSSANLKDAAWNLAIGQSVGNPNVRNEWETDDLFENHRGILYEQSILPVVNLQQCVPLKTHR